MAKIDEVAFAEHARQGMSISELSRTYGVSHYIAKKQRDAILSEDAPEGSEPATQEDTQNVFELKTNVPTEKLDALLAGFNYAEIRRAVESMEPVDKANLIQIVLQQRMDHAVSPRMAIVAPLEPLQLENGVYRG